MPVARPTAVVPTFGDWFEADNNDVSYTLLFEKIRSSKNEKPLKSQELHKSSQMLNKKHPEGKKCTVYPQPEYNTENILNSPATKFEYGKHITVEGMRENIRKKAHELHSSSRRKPSLEQIADHILAESHGNDSHVFLHRSSSNGNSSVVRHCDKFSRENYFKDKHFGHNSNHGIANHQVHKGRFRGKFPSASPARNEKVFSAASPTPNYKQQGSLQSRSMSSEMTSSRNLPTFGNWDAIDPDKVEFTILFDKARNEKENSSSVSKGFTKRSVAPIVDEDLYKPRYTHKRHNGFWSMLFCSKV